MRVLIATVQVPFVQGGAEMLASGLLAALRREGHEAEIAAIPFKWYPANRILDHMLACRLLDITESCGQPVDRVIGLKFPAYLIPHPNKVMWLLHQHRDAYDMWDHPLGGLIHSPNGAEVRDAIRHADQALIPEARNIFTISKNVSARLKHYNEIESRPLYHPPGDAGDFHCAEAQDYFFYPSRLGPMKRQAAVLQALAQTSGKVRVKFAGTPDTPAYANELKKLAADLGVEQRVEWLGRISQEEKCNLYASATGVLFPTVDEDYGYVTLEAMLASKPLITCKDSGAPLEFVLEGKTGIVAEPQPESIAAAMDKLWADRALAAEMGRSARIRYDSLNLGWQNVVQRLLE